MILTVEKLKEFITTDVSDQVLQARLEALETSIRNKTHNNFQDRRIRTVGDVSDDGLYITLTDISGFNRGDTVMIDENLVVLGNHIGNTFEFTPEILPEDRCLVTKVVYPKDVVMGVVDVMSWMLSNPSAKAGISSETLSRHSVTYQGNDEYDKDVGCPVRLLSFLNQYKKARF